MPVIQLGRLALPVYPLALMFGLWLGMEAGARAARRRGLDGDHVYNAVLFALAAGLVVGRLAHVVAFWPAYRAQPLEIIGLNTRAFLLWPGALAAAAMLIIYIQRRMLPWPAMLDALAFGALVALGVAHLGAFIAGRSLGAPSTLPWAVTQWNVARHPVQLYLALAALAGAVIVWRLFAQGRAPGTPALAAVLIYGTAHWFFEPFHAGGPILPGGFRLGQVLGLGVVLLALWLLRARSLISSRPAE